MRNGKLLVAAAFGALVGAALFGTLRPASAARDGRAMCAELEREAGAVSVDTKLHDALDAYGMADTDARRAVATVSVRVAIHAVARAEAASLLRAKLCTGVIAPAPSVASPPVPGSAGERL